MQNTIQTFAVYALPLLFAITLHEAAHAYAAKYFGDATAFLQGRMSLNPIRHIDPIGTILIPAIMLLLPGSFLFGYAKPVPIDYGKLRKPKRDMAWVALAGPASNLAMALAWKILGILLKFFDVQEEFLLRVIDAGILVNLLIFAFNLFPLPPLDGGRILTSMLPHKQAYEFAKIEPYGFFIVLALAYTQVLKLWMGPLMLGADILLQLLVYPLNLLLL